MEIFGVAQIIQIADLHIKIRMTYARLHLHIPWQVRVNRQVEARVVGLSNLHNKRKSFGFFSFLFGDYE